LTALREGAPDAALVGLRLASAHSRAWRRALLSPRRRGEAQAHLAQGARLWRELLAGARPAIAGDPAFPGEAALAATVLRRAGHLEEALAVTGLGLAALDRGAAGRRGTWLAGTDRGRMLSVRLGILGALDRPREGLAVCEELMRMRATSPVDRDELLADSVLRLDEAHRCARLAADDGQLDLADRSLAGAEQVLLAAEQRFAAAPFASARVEHEWARATILERRASLAGSPAERRRLRAAASAAYAAALDRADRLARHGGLHGVSGQRLAELRRESELAALAARAR
jgi:hypothetical protein